MIRAHVNQTLTTPEGFLLTSCRPEPPAAAFATASCLPGPDTRREYVKLLGDLAILTRSFGISLPGRARSDAAALTFCIECADRLVDATSDRVAREQLGKTIISVLHGDFGRDTLDSELAYRLARLRVIAERDDMLNEVCGIVGRLLRNSELMRATQSPSEFVECAAREGRWMVELLLLVIGDSTTPEFDEFMRRVSVPANLIDKLRDAAVDFEGGQIAIRPTLNFRLLLFCQLALLTLRLLRSCLGNWRLALWGIRALFAESRGIRLLGR